MDVLYSKMQSHGSLFKQTLGWSAKQSQPNELAFFLIVSLKAKSKTMQLLLNSTHCGTMAPWMCITIIIIYLQFANISHYKLLAIPAQGFNSKSPFSLVKGREMCYFVSTKLHSLGLNNPMSSKKKSFSSKQKNLFESHMIWGHWVDSTSYSLCDLSCSFSSRHTDADARILTSFMYSK